MLNLRCLLLSILLLLLLALPTLAQEDDLTMTWLASGAATASYSPNDSDYSLALEGTHAEFTLYQDRSVYTNLFNGLHLIGLEFSGEGTDSDGNKHAPEYANASLLYSLGLDIYLAEFIHLQPFAAYGFGATRYSKSYTAADGTITPYEEKTVTADIGIYGVNLIVELFGKVWVGYGLNYYLESQPIEYRDITGSLALQSSQTLMLVWNWERVPIKTIDPKASFWSWNE